VKDRALLLSSAFLVGFSAMIGQIVLMRELMSVFYGNELSLGITLSAWLLWGGVGSLALGKTADLIRDKIKAISLFQILIPLLLLASIFAARNVKSLFEIPFGEVMGIGFMIGTSFLMLSLYCAGLGYLFVLIAKATSQISDHSSQSVGKVYMFEGLGASSGGMVTGLALIKLLNPFEIAAVVMMLNLMVSLSLQARFPRRPVWLILPSSLLALISYLTLSGSLDGFNRFSSALGWRGMRLVETRSSVYGNIVVTSYGSQYNFFENGLWILASDDEISAEENVHLVMLEHPDPKSVLLIGGGLNGSGNEVLKHGVERMVYVELDPMLTETARRYLRDEIGFLEDDRVELIHSDARFFIKRADERFDVVIVNLPDPLTAMLNRFYSREFFGEVRRILNPGGIISVSLSSSASYLNVEGRRLLRSIYRTMREVFPDVVVLPGEVNFIIGKLPDRWDMTLDPTVLADRLRSREVKTALVNELYIRFRLTPDKVGYLERVLAESDQAEVNRDFHPIGYLYSISLWSSQFRWGGGRFIDLINGIKTWHLASLIFAISLIGLLVRRRGDMRGIVLSVGATGFSEISFQVVVMLAFQVLYGYVYYKLSVILTSFMIGLVFGSWAMSRWMGGLGDKLKTYVWIQVSICFYPLFLASVIALLSKVTGHKFGSPIVQAAFLFLPIVAGFIGGVQFPLANDIILSRVPLVGRTVGLLYGVDLLGSCLGAFLTGLLLIPLFGIYGTCLLTASLNFSVLPWVYKSLKE
jgi:spermidine synthase